MQACRVQPAGEYNHHTNVAPLWVLKGTLIPQTCIKHGTNTHNTLTNEKFARSQIPPIHALALQIALLAKSRGEIAPLAHPHIPP